MRIARITAAIVTILYGFTTFIAYWVVILPNHGPEAPPELFFSFGFAGLGIIGGLLALFKSKVATFFLVLSCIAYALSALYPPIHYFGSVSLLQLNAHVYIGFVVRCALATVLIYILHKGADRAKLST